MHACQRVIALCVMLLWAVGWIPTSGGAAREDHASKAEHFGVLGYRDDEAATDAPNVGPDGADDSWLVPRDRGRLAVAGTDLGGATACAHDPGRDRGCLAGSPRGPPAFA